MLKGITGLLKTLQNNAIFLAVFATLLSVVGYMITVLSGGMFKAIRVEMVALIVSSINCLRESVWEKIVAGLEKV